MTKQDKLMNKLKQFFCRHTQIHNVSTTPNIKAGVYHYQCNRCNRIFTEWELGVNYE